MKYFFWIAFAVFLAASIPHVAYFFASFEPSQGPEGAWWWAVSYAIAISIDVTVYLLSYTAFTRYRKYRTARSVWRHWLLIIMCTFFSWAVNWAYAKQFHSPIMLNAAEATAPWLTTLFPFMASAFPLLGIVYTMMAESISETEENSSLVSLTELIKQKQLPGAAQRQALASGQKQAELALIGRASSTEQEQESAQAKIQEESRKEEVKQQDTSTELQQPITGQFIALDTENSTFSQFASDTSAKGVSESNPPKLHAALEALKADPKMKMALEALKADPKMSDEALAEHLSLKRPASARFWRLKAAEILNAPEKEVAV